ncbi:MAG TPA: hypothetical protein VEB21_14110 [Terriglobales bacterium]|nr:hypothetical protein [Terriglobales bacterium]
MPAIRAAYTDHLAVALLAALSVLYAAPVKAQLDSEIALWPQSIVTLPSAPSTDTTLAARSRAGDLRNPDSNEIRLLRERDPAGYKRYTLMVSSLSAVQFRARFRKDGRSGLAPSTRTTAVGIAMPWHQYSLEIEGVNESDIGKSLLGSVRWRGDAIECGLTVPLLAPKELRGAVLLQFVYRFGDNGRHGRMPAMTAGQLGYPPSLLR